MILVLGATGFLGKRVVRKLEELKLEYTKSSQSMGVDLRNKEETFHLFSEVKPEYVINCAAYVGGIQFGLKHSGEMFLNNMLMQINILEACREYDVKRLVNPISNCAYPGKATLFKESEFWDGPLHESVQVYGFVKKAMCMGAYAYKEQYGCDIVNIIISNMYGPEDHFEEERSHALGALIMKIVKAKREDLPSVTIWGTGNPVREWLHVDDGAEALIRAMNISSQDEPINIGVSSGISIKDMAEMIKEIVGYEGDFVYDTSKPDGAPYKTVDGSRGEAIFGWKPEISFRQGLEMTIQWYLDNY